MFCKFSIIYRIAGCMSRFVDFSLYKRTDELLRPAEKSLRDLFLSPTNTVLVYNKALVDIDSGVSYVDVTTAMDAVFRTAVHTDNLPEVSVMNNRVLDNIRAATDRVTSSRDRYAERAFGKSNLPTHFLPRPSHESYDEDTFELFRN